MTTYYYQFIQIRTCRPNIIMLIAGSSAGSEDFTPSIVRADGSLRISQDVSDLSEESHF
ncbi:MAG: hypothetical protein Q7U03_06020 [Syntrophales bacterium]|nr:hypothetical protein [Syntrophales bacterium]